MSSSSVGRAEAKKTPRTAYVCTQRRTCFLLLLVLELYFVACSHLAGCMTATGSLIACEQLR